LSAIRVGEAIIFPAFNDVLQATVGVPNAAAQELAATGDPVRAVAAGVNSAVGTVNAAVGVVAGSIVDGIENIRAAAGQSSQGSMLALTQKSTTTTTSVRTNLGSSGPAGTTPKHASVGLASSHPLGDVASKVRQAARSVVKNASDGGAHHSVSGKPKH
jgi:hypothetical protein